MLGNLAHSVYRTNAESLPKVQETLLFGLRNPDQDPRRWIFSEQDIQQSCLLHSNGMISDAELVATFLLANTQRQHRNLWLGGTSSIDPSLPIAQQISKLKLRSVKQQALMALELWAKGAISAKACFGKVRVSDLVSAQAAGWRYVGISDDAEFIAHDLCHLFRFYFPNTKSLLVDDYHFSQKGFFVLAQGLLPALIARGWVVDEDYEDQAPLNHIVTDMNGEGIFLHAALLAKIIELLRMELKSDVNLLPNAMRLIWAGYADHQVIGPAENASNPIIASRMVEALLILMGKQDPNTVLTDY